MLHEDAKFAEDTGKKLASVVVNNEMHSKKICKCYFDGTYSKEGAGAGFLLISPEGNLMPFSFKLEFDSTNNVAKYEALISSLQVAKQMGVQCISIYGDSKLIIRQIKNHYQTKHLRLRSYTMKFGI